jgi:hypothetical protein
MERNRMTVKWEIRSEQAREQEALDRWGKEEWARRKAVIAQKQDELEAESGFEARCIIGTQFEPIARMLDQDKWDKFATMPVAKWERLVLKLAGVS